MASAVLLLFSFLVLQAFAASAPSEKQLKLEARYEAQLKAENLRNWMRQFTSRPHNVGSPKAKENAEFIASLFKKWGYETEIEVFHVLFPTPKTRELSLLRPYPFRASLKEQIIKTDSVADALEKEALPPYNAYSGEGEVIGPLVYVNQGIPRDYEELERRGINVKGKIVIAEIKINAADFRADQKWPEYMDFCDLFYFAVPLEFPVEILPEESGLILADAYSGDIARPSPKISKPLRASRRRELTLRFARAAAKRLRRWEDPVP